MLKTQSLALLTTVLALAANACSAAEARPVVATATASQCIGGSVRSADDAERFLGCDVVAGDLRIVGSDLTDVSAFQNLRAVTGRVIVTDNAKLVSLAGFKKLEHARSVEIRNNPVLSGYFGLLPDLQRVEQPLVLDQNRGLSKREVNAVLDRIEVATQNAGADVVASSGAGEN